MPTYIERSAGSYTISSSGVSFIGPGGGINMGYSVDGDNCEYVVYCSTVTVTGNGTVHLMIAAMGDGASIYAQASTSSGVLNTTTGEVAPKLTGAIASAYTSPNEFFALDVSAGTYKFYIRLANRTYLAAVILSVNYEKYDHRPWRHEDIYLGGHVETIVTRTIPTSEQSQYTLYQCYVRSDYSGSGSFVIESTGVAPTIMYIASNGTESAYSHNTGELYSQYVIQQGEGPGRLIIDSDVIRHGTHFWIRHDSPTTVSEISFTIYPPGATWSTFFVGSSSVTSAGYSKQFSAGALESKTVDYIELRFDDAGTYQIKAEASDSMYGYLATDFSINSNGRPSSDSDIVGSDTSDSAGFAFSVTVDGYTDKYYLLFRTADGNPNSYDFTITITPVGEYVYSELSAMESIAGTRTKSVSFTSSGTRYRVRYFRTTYAGSGTATVRIQNPRLNGLVIYMVPDRDYGYNSTTGAPYIDGNHTEAIGGPTQTFDVVPGNRYFIWVRTTYPDVSGSEVVSISWTEKQWTYPSYSDLSMLERVTTTQEFSLSEKTGAMFRCSFKHYGEASLVVEGMSSAIIYVTEGNFGFNSNGVPYANRAQTTLATGSTTQTIAYALLEQWYYVWVSPGTSTSSGTATVTITPPTVTVEWQLDDRTSDSSTRNLNVNLENKWISLSRAHTAEYLVSFTRSGTAKFRSYGSVEVSIYFGDSSSTISTSDGIPADSDASDIGDPDFYLEVEVAAGTTYHIWIKGNDEFVEGGSYLTIVVPENVSTTRGYWIWVNVSGSTYEWVKLTPYVGNMSRVWQEYKGYVATSEGWPDPY